MIASTVTYSSCFSVSSKGSSDVAFHIEQKGKDAYEEFFQAETWRWKSNLVDDIHKIARERTSEGWDGYEASPIRPDAAFAAVGFANLLDYSLLPPEPTPEPDGCIALDWRRGETQLSVAVGPAKVIFAAILGGGELLHGEAPFDGRKIPGILHTILRQRFLNA